MALNFPNNPAPGQVFTAEGATFLWNGAVWMAQAPAVLPWATPAEALAGVVADKVMSPATTKAVTGTFSVPVGVGQVWKTIALATVPVNTAHQNTKGRSIMMSVSGRSTDGNGRPVQVSVDAVAWVTVGNFPSSAVFGATPVNFILSAGHYWRVNGTVDSTYGVSELS